MKRMACVLALATSASLTTAALAPALAEKVTTPAGNGLQLTLTAAGTVPADAALTLDVRFEGGSLRMVELQVDGTTVKKKSLLTRSNRGHLEFEIESGLLGEGLHDIVIRAQDASGNIATTTTQVKVTSGATTLVKFVALKSKSMVQGVVPIEVKLDPSIHNPYVTFLIDDAFQALTNYAPFTLNWDSTKVTNGLHTVSIEVYDGDTLAKVKSTSLQLNINNPGGLTNRQNETPDLRSNKSGGANPTATAINSAIDSSRYSAVPHSNLETPGASDSLSRLSASAPSATGALRSTAPGNLNSESAPAKPVSPLAPINTISKLVPATPVAPAAPYTHVMPISSSNIDRANSTENRVKVGKPGVLGVFADPRQFATLAASNPSSRLAHTVHPRRAGNMAARPALTMEMDAVESTPAHVSAPKREVEMSHEVAPIKIARGARVLPGFNNAQTMQIAFDNTRIAFDVPPRVEHGMPIAPFRQIFEHTGGAIQWFNQSKTLRAFSGTREIELHVGDSEAKVNNQTVQIEAKTFIEKGRTLVPLSFVRDALDVTVTYDAVTGHLRIESKK